MESIRSDGRSSKPPKSVAHAWQDFAKQMTHKNMQKGDSTTLTTIATVEHTAATHAAGATAAANAPTDRHSLNPWKSYAQEEYRLHRPVALPPKPPHSSSPPSSLPHSTSTSTSTSTATSHTTTSRRHDSSSPRRLSCSSERAAPSNGPSTILCFCQLPAAVLHTEEFGPILECHYSSGTDLTQHDGGVECPPTICAFHLHKHAWLTIKRNHEAGKYRAHEELRVCPYFNSVVCILLRTANDYPKRFLGAPKCYCNEAAIYSASRHTPHHFYFYCTHCTFFTWASQAYILPRDSPVHPVTVSTPTSSSTYCGKPIDTIPNFTPSTVTSCASPRPPSDHHLEPKSVPASPTREPQRVLLDTLTKSDWDKENASIYMSAAPRPAQPFVRLEAAPRSNPPPIAADFLRLLEAARLPEMDRKATAHQDEKQRPQPMLVPTSVLMQRSAKAGSTKADDLLRQEKQRKASARAEKELERLLVRLHELRAEYKYYSDRKHLRTELMSRMRRDIYNSQKKYDREVQKERSARRIEKDMAASIEQLEQELKSKQERRLRLEEYVEPFTVNVNERVRETDDTRLIYNDELKEKEPAEEARCRVCSKPNANYALIPCFHIGK